RSPLGVTVGAPQVALLGYGQRQGTHADHWREIIDIGRRVDTQLYEPCGHRSVVARLDGCSQRGPLTIVDVVDAISVRQHDVVPAEQVRLSAARRRGQKERVRRSQWAIGHVAQSVSLPWISNRKTVCHRTNMSRYVKTPGFVKSSTS